MEEVTIISTLPPIKGISFYTMGFLNGISSFIKIRFLGFNKIYPKLLYPATIYDYNCEPYKPSPNICIKNILNWYNPVGWVIEAFRIKTKIIHAQWWSYPLAPIYITILGINKLRKKKIIITVHNVKPHEQGVIKNFLSRAVINLGSEYFVHSKQNKIELKSIVKNKKIHVIPHGIIQPPLSGINKIKSREKLGLNQDDKLLLFFGNIREYKGLDVALKSLKMIKDKKVKLLIAGQCWGKWEKYEKIISDNNLQDRVIVKLGFVHQQDVELFFKASDLVLLPYKYFNSQSGVGALALSFDIPLIVSRIGGLADFVDSQVCLNELGDFRGLADKITSILNNKTLYLRLQKEIINKKNYFNWTNIGKNIFEKYQDLLNSK